MDFIQDQDEQYYYQDYINIEKIIRIQYGKDEFKTDGAWLTLEGYPKKMFIDKRFADLIIKRIEKREREERAYVYKGNG